MNEITNNDVIKFINKRLDPVMKKEGFKRSGRTYYKQIDDLIFILNTSAVTTDFTRVTRWPSYTFTITEGVWVDGISPGILKRYPKKKDKYGYYIPEPFNCFHINPHGILRSTEAPYAAIAEKYNITNTAEIKRCDIWIMPEDKTKQEHFGEELQQQVVNCFLNRYQAYTDIDKLQHLILDEPRRVNNANGFFDDTPFVKNNFWGNRQYYLDYSVLFHQHYGSEEQYLFYLSRLEEWSKLNKRKIPSSYYCGFGNEFKL